MYPWVYELGLNRLRDLGFEIKEMRHTRSSNEELWLHPEKRAADLHAAFQDPNIKAIIASIGGEDSIRTLPHINFELLLKHPKILMGFSDTTTLLAALNLRGLITFHGPTVMAGLAENGKPNPEFINHLINFLLEPCHQFVYKPFSYWTDETLDWADIKNLEKNKHYFPQEGWKVIQQGGVAEGTLFGGCLEVLDFLKGTEYWPKRDFWDGKILFLETSEEKPSLASIRRSLRNYGVQGVLNKIKGLMVGRPFGYNNAEKQDLYAVIQDVVIKEFHATSIPIITNMDFGHTSPQWIMPLGIQARIDAMNKTFTLLESPFLDKA